MGPIGVAVYGDAPVGGHPIDSTHVVVVDYDLLRYSPVADTTGSRVAYLLRCFSQCGAIIVVNKYGSMFNPDLSYACNRDFADVHISSRDLGNAGLWERRFDGYRPWHWPVVTNTTETFEQCVADVQHNLNTPIADFLGLGRVADWLPYRTTRFLGEKHPFDEVTFEQVARSPSGGAHWKDQLIPGQIARVAAARVQFWLNSMVLPHQNVLVDAPHLVSRFPSLITNGRDDIEAWNQLCVASNRETGRFLDKRLAEYKFQRSHWLHRPGWFWPEISQDETIDEVNNPWGVGEVDWVFCEDQSRFVPIEHAQEVYADVSPPFIHRFVSGNASPGAELERLSTRT